MVHLTPSPLAPTDTEAAQGSTDFAAVPDVAAPSADMLPHLTQGKDLQRRVLDTG